MRRLALTVASAAFAVVAGTVLAQSTGPNGGLVDGAGSHQTELVVNATEITIYLLEHGKPHDTKGASLRAVVQQGGKTTTVNLADQGGTKLVATLPAPLDKGAIVVVTGKDSHGDRFSARYVIK
jgi:hypothetical protein